MKQVDRWRGLNLKIVSPKDIMLDEDVAFEGKTLTGHTGNVQAMCFSSDSSLLATSAEDMTIRVWDSVTGNAKHVLQGHKKGDGWLSRLDGLLFSPTKNILVSGGAEGVIKVWDPLSGKCLRDLAGQKSWIKAMAFSFDGRHLVSVSADATVVLWDTSSFQKSAEFKGHKGEVECVAFSPSGKFFATGGLDDSTIHIWDVQEQKLHTSMHHEGSVHSISFGADDSLLASASNDKTTRLWDANTGGMVHLVNKHAWAADKVVFSPDGNFLVSCGASPAFKVVSLLSNSEYILNANRTGYLVAISPDNRLLITGERDNSSLQIWNISNGECVAWLSSESYDEYIMNFNLSPNGRLVASGHKNGKVYLRQIGKLYPDAQISNQSSNQTSGQGTIKKYLTALLSPFKK